MKNRRWAWCGKMGGSASCSYPVLSLELASRTQLATGVWCLRAVVTKHRAHLQTTPTLAINFTTYEMSKAFMMRIMRAGTLSLMPGGAPVPPTLPPASPRIVEDPVSTDVVVGDPKKPPPPGPPGRAHPSAAWRASTPGHAAAGARDPAESRPEPSRAAATNGRVSAATTAKPANRGRVTNSSDAPGSSHDRSSRFLAENGQKLEDSVRVQLAGDAEVCSLDGGGPSGRGMQAGDSVVRRAAEGHGHWVGHGGDIEYEPRDQGTWEPQRQLQLSGGGGIVSSLASSSGQEAGAPRDIALQLRRGPGHVGVNPAELGACNEGAGRGEAYSERGGARTGEGAEEAAVVGFDDHSRTCWKQAGTQSGAPSTVSREAFKQWGVGSKAVISLVAGSASGVVSSTVTFPLDVVRRNLQVRDGTSESYAQVCTESNYSDRRRNFVIAHTPLHARSLVISRAG
jgi:hypothetical protein